jgi:prephenate dehydrogenase
MAILDRIQHVTIIGVGLLGGSAALALKARKPSIRIAGVGRRQESLDEALSVGAADTVHLDPAEPLAETDLVLLCTPVRAFGRILAACQPALREGTIITDVGSTKADVVAEAEDILGRSGPFVGSHPMAGSEQKGVAFSRADLFEGALCIVTPSPETPAELADGVEAFWAALGMRTARLTPDAHDKAVARVSHLPHALASLLMLLPDDADLPVSATGLRDTTRLASGDPEMWRDIFLTNAPACLEAIDRYAAGLAEFRKMVAEGDGAALEAFLDRAKRRRDATLARSLEDRRVAME